MPNGRRPTTDDSASRAWLSIWRDMRESWQGLCTVAMHLEMVRQAS